MIENSFLHKIAYSYDALGRRNSRSRIESGSGVQTGTKEVWSYEGNGFNLLKRETTEEEFEITKAQLSANGTRTRVLSPVNSSQNRSKEVTSLQKYVTTGRSVSCVYSLKDTPESSNIKRAAYSGNISITYLQLDSQGSVISQMNQQGEQTNKITYDAFGNTINGSIDEAMPFGYNGKVMDTDTNQYNYGYRDYIPTAGRFSTVDPIKDGTSWYDYCGSDPVNFVDLWGLCAESDTTNMPEGVLDQNDPALNSIENMAESGCNYRSCQNVAEKETNTALTAEQIISSVEANIASGAIDSDMRVNNPDSVINDAFDRLGEPETTATVGWGGEEGQEADYTIMWGDTPINSNPDGADHALFGDENSNLLNDPYNPDIQGIVHIYSNEVFIHRIEEGIK